MGARGVEPPTLAGPDPKSGAYASSATRPKSLLPGEAVIIISSAPPRTERCQSGRSGSPRKRVSPQGDRGFESHPLRHHFQIARHLFSDVIQHKGITRFEIGRAVDPN